jgi:hypothetical protein
MSQTISLAISDGVTNFNVVQAVTGAQKRGIGPLVLAPATTNTEIDIVLTRADIQSIVLQSVGGDLTIKTNSTGSPGDTVALTAGQILVWCIAATGIQAIGADPFPTADVTKLFLSSMAGTTFTLRAEVTAANG